MTPGFAQPRSKLPWLPYESLDRVRIINSHNFTPISSGPTLIGDEVAVWCPSLDTAGNGTATLNDLTGSRSATLTNMALPISWVDDADNGGVRALSFDGSNDRLAFASVSIALPFSISIWLKTSATGTQILAEGGSNESQLFVSSGRIFMGIRDNGGAQITGPIINDGTWKSVTAVWASTTDRRLYVNGSLVGSSAVSAAAALSITQLMARNGPSLFYNGLADDIRIFNGAKTLADATALASKRGY